MARRILLPGDLDPVATNGLLCAGVGPRPIALASTVDGEGRRNLAPFSFFNAFGSRPPMVALAPNRRARDGAVKDTYLNVRDTGAFVVAAVSHGMVHRMNLAGAEFPRGADEFAKTGLTPLPATRVAPALVAESPFQMECRLDRILELGEGPGSGLLLLGEVLAFHVAEEVWGEGGPDARRLDLVGRLGGAWYVRASGEALFRLPKAAGLPMGVDALPAPLRLSPILTGEDLARLGSVPALPDLRPEPRPGDPAEGPALERAIQVALRGDDLDEAWRLAALRLAP